MWKADKRSEIDVPLSLMRTRQSRTRFGEEQPEGVLVYPVLGPGLTGSKRVRMWRDAVRTRSDSDRDLVRTLAEIDKEIDRRIRRRVKELRLEIAALWEDFANGRHGSD